METKIILITGSTDGIGRETAKLLVKEGHHVLIHGRNNEKTQKTIDKIKLETEGLKIESFYADLESFGQIKEMSNQIHKKFDYLDVLINNAGVLRPKRSLTQEGLEETFAINYVAPFLLTNLLIDLIKKSKAGRIVNVVSQVHSNNLDFGNLQFEKGYTGVKAYANSKTSLIMFTYLLAEKLKHSNITVNCVHPGIINTKLLEVSMGAPRGAPVSKGAEALIYAATSPELEGISGKYLINNSIDLSKAITFDKNLQKKLWQKTEEFFNLAFK